MITAMQTKARTPPPCGTECKREACEDVVFRIFKFAWRSEEIAEDYGHCPRREAGFALIATALRGVARKTEWNISRPKILGFP